MAEWSRSQKYQCSLMCKSLFLLLPCTSDLGLGFQTSCSSRALVSHRGKTMLSQLLFSSVFLQGTSATSSFCSAHPEGEKRNLQRCNVFFFTVKFNKQQPSELPSVYDVGFLHSSLCLVCPDLNGTNLTHPLVNHFSRAFPD